MEKDDPDEEDPDEENPERIPLSLKNITKKKIITKVQSYFN